MRKVVVGFIGIAILIAGMVSCTENTEQKPEEKKPLPVEEARAAIDAFRADLLDAKGPLDTNKANTMIDLYISFVQANPADPEAQEYLFQAGSVAMAKGDYDRSLKLLKQATRNYPDEKRSPDCLFVSAYINHYHLDRRGAAEDFYKELIDQFPNHNLSIDARLALKNINLSDEELIEQFEKKNGIEG